MTVPNPAPLFKILTALACLLGFLPPATAASPITATPLTQDLHLRKNAPIPLELRVQHSGQGVETGRFEATLLYRDQRAATITSQEFVFGSGERTVLLMLPPPPGIQDGDALAMRLRWLNGKSATDLGETRLGIYGFASNELILAVVRTGRRIPELHTTRERSLALENLRPRLDTAGWRTFSTILAPIPVEALPTHPLGWCAYDSVFLDTAAFASTSDRQLTALGRWLEAGGSAFIAAGDDSPTPLTERHAAFLTRLAGNGGPVFRAEAGRITPSTPSTNPVRLRPMLGRVSVELSPGREEKDYETNAWNAAVGWSWKLREAEIRVVEAKGKWSPGALRGRAEGDGTEEWQLASWLWSSAIGYDALSPDKPRPLPLGMVALLLGTLLLAVGPGDWLLLGWLRRRRWTWVLLPILCVLAGWWAASLAARTIGRGDRTGLVTLTDIGPDGRILRECRMEMILPARDREWTVQARDGIASPFARVGQGLFALPSERQDIGDNSGEWKTSTLFEHRRSLRQWTPVMAQSTTFPESRDTTGIEWDVLAAQWGRLDSAGRSRTLLASAGWNVVFAADRDSLPPAPAPVPDAQDFDWQPPFTALRIEGRINEQSRMRYDAAYALLDGSASSATKPLLSHRSPLLTGAGALLAAPPSPLTALAWRETAHEIHIIRRHFSRMP